VSAPPVKLEGAAAVGPTGVAVAVLPDPFAAVPLLEPLEPEPVGELPVPVTNWAEPDPAADPEPEPEPEPEPDVPLLGGLGRPDADGRTMVDIVLSGQYVVVKVSVTVTPAEV